MIYTHEGIDSCGGMELELHKEKMEGYDITVFPSDFAINIDKITTIELVYTVYYEKYEGEHVSEINEYSLLINGTQKIIIEQIIGPDCEEATKNAREIYDDIVNLMKKTK